MSKLSHRQRRQNAEQRQSTLRRLIDVVGQIVMTVVVGLFFSFIMLNWLTGCGERFPTANGGYIQGECITPLSIYKDNRAELSTGSE